LQLIENFNYFPVFPKVLRDVYWTVILDRKATTRAVVYALHSSPYGIEDSKRKDEKPQHKLGPAAPSWFAYNVIDKESTVAAKHRRIRPLIYSGIVCSIRTDAQW